MLDCEAEELEYFKTFVVNPTRSLEHHRCKLKCGTLEVLIVISVLFADEAPNQRERQRLTRLKCEHSGAWVCATPANQDGNDTVMRPRNFQVAVALRLGLPVLDEEKKCSLCM